MLSPPTPQSLSWPGEPKTICPLQGFSMAPMARAHDTRQADKDGSQGHTPWKRTHVHTVFLVQSGADLAGITPAAD